MNSASANGSSILASLRAAVMLAASAMLGGCYLMQTAQGQLSVMSKRKPIDRVVADPATPVRVRDQLRVVKEIRDFATRELGLPDNGSYRSYADVRRAYVVWNVFAAPEFSLTPKQWCYPIAGCVAYRGYFKEQRAKRFAAVLRGQGYDVATGGVAAYSTLGHFNDPILNTMLGWNDIELASIVFHELTHQLLYVPNDSAFNEALATLVEEEGVRRWLEAHGRSRDTAQYELAQQRYLQIVDLLIHARERLARIYGSKVAPAEMRKLKAAELARLHAAFDAKKAQWGGRAPFEGWFAGQVNNAHLVSVATYHRCVPGLKRELDRADGDLRAFYARMRVLAKETAVARERQLCAEAGR